MALNTRQKRAIEAFLRGLRSTQVADAVGVSARTITNWRNDDEFDRALREATQRATRDATLQLAGSAQDAVELMRETVKDDDAPAATRLRAATAIIENMLKLYNVVELAERIEALEQRISHV